MLGFPFPDFNVPVQHMEGTDRSLQMGHNALPLRHIAGNLLNVLSHRHDNTWHGLWWAKQCHPWEQVSDPQMASGMSTLSNEENMSCANHQSPDCQHVFASSITQSLQNYDNPLCSWGCATCPSYTSKHATFSNELIVTIINNTFQPLFQLLLKNSNGNFCAFYFLLSLITKISSIVM